MASTWQNLLEERAQSLPKRGVAVDLQAPENERFTAFSKTKLQAVERLWGICREAQR
jgi:hypothetical protein